MYTHLLSHAHFSLVPVTHFHECAHAWLKVAQKGVCSVYVVSFHLALSALMSHPSSLLFLDNFDTLFQSFTFTARLPGLSRPKSAAPAHFRTGEEDFGYMANYTHNTGYMSPSSVTRLFLRTRTRRPSTIQTTIASLTSRKLHTKTLDGSVFLQCVKPPFRRFLVVTLLFRKKAKKA